MPYLLSQSVSDCIPILHYAAGLGIAYYTIYCGTYWLAYSACSAITYMAGYLDTGACTDTASAR